MGRVSFSISSDGSVKASGGGDTYRNLRAMIGIDIGASKHFCLDYLCSIAEIEEGSVESGEHEGEVYETVIEKSGVSITHNFLSNKSARYDFGDFKEVIESYWKFIQNRKSASHIVREFRPDLSEVEAALVEWEGYWKKRHPYRGRIEGIPAVGPE